MASTSSASAKHGERKRNMQRHMALASGVSSYNYKLHEDSAELAKRSQKLLCSPAVDLRHLYGAARSAARRAGGRIVPRMLNTARPAKPAPIDERASTRCSTPHRDVNAEDRAPLSGDGHIGGADPGLYMVGRLDQAVFFWETPTRPTLAGHHFSQVHLRDWSCSALRPARAVPAHRRTPGRWRRNRLAQSSMSNRRRPRSDAPSRRRKPTFAATLARAKRLDAQGHRAGCTRALAAAKRMYNL